jgi:hypothetical protein
MPRKSAPVLKSVAIHQLRDLAVELKKTPTANDVIAGARQKKCPPMSVINKLFGGVAAAVKEAGLPPQRNQEFTEEELIAQLQNLSSALGRHVTRRDVRRAGKAGTCARLVTFRRVFGNAGNAFRKAGVQATNKYTREELIAQYIALHKEIGRLPTYEDIHRAAREGKCAGWKVFRNTCGTLEQLRRAAQLPSQPRRKYSQAEMLDQLRRLAAKLGRSPMAKEVIAACRKGECADIQTFKRIFRTYNRALKAAGLAVRPRSFSRGQLILMLQALAKKLGHRPTVKEVNEAKLRGECASAPTYDDHFGRMSAALRAAGLDRMPARVVKRKPRKGRKKYTREQMQEQLKRLCDKLGRPARQQDAYAACARRECPGVTALAKEFGSFGAALRSIGLDAGQWTERRARAQLIEQLRDLARELGRLPTSRDIGRAKSCASASTFSHHFGSLVSARKAAGLDELLGRRDAERRSG